MVTLAILPSESLTVLPVVSVEKNGDQKFLIVFQQPC